MDGVDDRPRGSLDWNRGPRSVVADPSVKAQQALLESPEMAGESRKLGPSVRSTAVTPDREGDFIDVFLILFTSVAITFVIFFLASRVARAPIFEGFARLVDRCLRTSMGGGNRECCRFGRCDLPQRFAQR
jgi:hypothetical protein